MANLPVGENTGVPAVPNPPNTTPPTLPLPSTNPAPAPPHTTQVGPKPAVPQEWSNPVRIIRVILDLYETDPNAAFELSQLARQKLADIKAGK